MNLNSLPPECLHHILSFLPLRDLLQSNQVCSLWASHQRLACVNRRQVTICIGDDAISRIFNSRLRMPYEEVLDPSTPADREPRLVYDAQNAEDNFDLLQFDWLNSVTCDKLVSLLPNVIELKVATCEVRPAIAIGEISWGRKSVLINQIITMLTRWRSTLEAFTVSIKFEVFSEDQQPEIEQDLWRLFQAINQLDSLRRLAIELDDYQGINIAPRIEYGSIDYVEDIEERFFEIEPFFSVLSHLEQFSFFDHGENFEVLLPSLIKHGGPESTLKRISLKGASALNSWRYNFLDQKRHLMQNVVHIPDHHIWGPDHSNSSLFDKFPRLEYITIKVDPLFKIPQSLKYLESLRSLTYLKMNLENSYFMNDTYDMNDDPCLPSVRVLMIYLTRLTHEDLHPFSWPSILPNLEILHYYHKFKNCKICKHDCTKKALLPWTRCPRIRRIYSGPQNVPKRWNLSELVEE